MHVAVLETGGTINGILDPAAPAPTRSRVVDWLREHRERLHLEIDARIVVMEDSRVNSASRYAVCQTSRSGRRLRSSTASVMSTTSAPTTP